MGRAVGQEPTLEPSQPLRRPVPLTYEEDADLGPTTGREGGPVAGTLPQWAPLLAHLPPAQRRGVSEGTTAWHSSACGSAAQLMEGVLPELALLLQAQGHGEQRGAALAGREAQQLLHQLAPPLWGTRGSVGHGRPGHGMPVPNPACRQRPALPAHSLGHPHLPAWPWRGRCPGRTGAGWAGPCGRAAAGAGGGAAAAPCGYSTAR